MTKEEIKTENAMIAKYMKHNHSSYNYHSDWNALIDVCNEILKEVHASKQLLLLVKENDLIRFSLVNFVTLSGVNQQINIRSTYLKVTDFIKFYNRIKI